MKIYSCQKKKQFNLPATSAHSHASLINAAKSMGTKSLGAWRAWSGRSHCRRGFRNSSRTDFVEFMEKSEKKFLGIM